MAEPPLQVIVLCDTLLTVIPKGVTVIVLVTGVSSLPHESVAVHVSVTVPPHGPIAVDVDTFEVPLIKHPPLKPLLNGNVLAAGNDP